MNTFRSIEELVTALSRERVLLKEMFSKRKTLSFRYDYAKALTDYKEERLSFLMDHGIIRRNDNFLELEDIYLRFFEEVLEVNEEINVGSIKASIDHLNETIEYYLNESKESAKYGYLREVKQALTNIALNTKRNVIDLKRNIDSTYKNEPNYKNKKSKLAHLDEKRKNIAGLIKETERTIESSQPTFFAVAMDSSLQTLVTDIRYSLNESSHNLIEIDRQIIEYLNLIEYQNRLIKKLHTIKYYHDQQTLETNTDIVQVLASRNPLWMENQPAYRLKPSLEKLRNSDEGLVILKEVITRQRNLIKHKGFVADALSIDELSPQCECIDIPDIYEIRNAFLASGTHLFKFVLQYDCGFKMDYEERLSVFCQIAANFFDELDITEEFQEDDNIKYPLIYPR